MNGKERSAGRETLVEAARRIGAGDERRDQVVAFDVALAVRDHGDEQTLVALDAMLDVLRTAPVPSYGTLVNVLTAVQHASVLPDGSLGAWRPSAGALGNVLEHAQESENEPLRRQVDDLLWALAERGLARAWLGRDAAAVASRVEASDLRAALERQAG